MQPIVLACAVSCLAVFGSPAMAQQTAPQSQQTQQASPNPPPPPVERPMPTPSETLPPPFPPMPSSRPSHRWVDVGEHHHQRSSEHHAAREHHPEKRKHAGARASRTKTQPSRQAIRRCHRMDYKQIMRDSSCRKLMKQDLEQAEHQHRQKSHQRHGKAKHHHEAHHSHSRK